MSPEPLQVVVHPGDGLVARHGSGVLVIQPGGSPEVHQQILDAMERACEGKDLPGTDMVRALVGILSQADPAAVPAFGACAPNDRGWALLLHKGVAAEVAREDGGDRLSGLDALTWVDRIIDGQFRSLSISPADQQLGAVDSRFRFTGGVVPGGGATLVRDVADLPTGSGAPAAPAPAATPPAPAPQPVAQPEPAQPQPAQPQPAQPQPAQPEPPASQPAAEAAPPLARREPASPPEDAGARDPSSLFGDADGSQAPPAQTPPGAPPPAASPAATPPAAAPPTSPPTAPPEGSSEAITLTSADIAAKEGRTATPDPAEAPEQATPEARAAPPAAPPAAPQSPAPQPAAPQQEPAAPQQAAPQPGPSSPTPEGQAVGQGLFARTSDPGPAVDDEDEPPTLITPPATDEITPVGDQTANEPLPEDDVPFESVGLGQVGADAMRDALPVLNEESSKDDAVSDESAPLVYGVLSPNGYFNHPDALYCAVTGVSMLHRTHVLVQRPRPPLGVVVADDGSTFTLNANYVVGREPEPDESVVNGDARPLKLADSERSLSRVHAEIRLVDWDVYVVDRESANGTYVLPKGAQQWQRLMAGEPEKIVPGTRIAFGKRVMTFESHHQISKAAS